MRRASILLCLFLLSFSPFCLADELLSVSTELVGRVYDVETGEPLSGAHVFLHASTLGTVTDSTGEFRLKGIPPGRQQIGASMMGYFPYSTIVEVSRNHTGSLNIGMSPAVHELDGVTVTSRRNRRWRKQLKTFTREVIGETPNASFAKILNPEVLDFDQRDGILSASAPEPLIIENKALGYRVHYSLIHCMVRNGHSQFKGVARFEEMKSRNKRKAQEWKRNRQLAYQGSLKHLLRILASAESMQEIEAHGFKLAVVPEVSSSKKEVQRALKNAETTPESLVQPIETEYERQLQVDGHLLVTYPGELDPNQIDAMYGISQPQPQITWLHVKSDSIVFHEEGFLLDAYSMTIEGHMGRERIADMLPLDYRQ